MERRFLGNYGFGIVLGVMLAGCNISASVQNSDRAYTQIPATANAVHSDTEEVQFNSGAINIGITEVELPKPCAVHAQNLVVKNLGDMIGKDHAQTNSGLKAPAVGKSLTLPQKITQSERQLVEDMERKSGRGFDKPYIVMIMTGHDAVINEFKREATEEKDAGFSSFAARTLPIFQKHFNAANAVVKSI